MSGATTTLTNCKVVDLGLGMASALVTQLLRELGAQVTRFEPASGDPFYAALPAYRTWHAGKTVRTASSLPAPEVEAALARADVCVLGGEDVPGLEWRPDATALARRHPSLALLAIDGYPPDSPAAGRPSAEVLVAARSGAVFEHFSTRPILTSLPVATYGAAAQGAAAVLGALVARRRTGRGCVARVSMLGGSLMWNISSWMAVDKPDVAYHTYMAKDAQQLIFRCADGVHVQITMGVPGAKDRLYAILGLETAPAVSGDRAMPSLKKDPRNFFGEVDLLQERFGTFESAALLAQLAKADIPAEPLLAAGGCWDDPQVVHNGVLARDPSGTQHVGLPFTLDAGAVGAMPVPSATADALPLASLRVLDLGTVIGGPYSSMVLHDLGAEVLRIEPLTGDIIRPFARWFASVSRGKRAAAVDLKAPEAIALVHRLVKDVDVVHHNFRPGVAERLGIGPKQLHAINPKLVVLETFGYGASGPKALAPGFDMIFQAWCGHELRGGGAAHAPLWYRAAVVDFTAGALGATSVLAALLHPRGAGATVRTNLLNAGLFLISELVRYADGTFAGAPAADDEQLGVRVAERLYRVADGWIALCVRGVPMARAFTRTLGLGDTVLDADPAAWSEPERARIAAVLATRSLREWQSTLDAAGVWCEPCRADAESDLYAGTGDALRYRLEAPHPHYGRTVQIGPLVTFPGRRQAPSGHIPTIGEHTAAAMAEAGYAPAEIEALRARKIVR